MKFKYEDLEIWQLALELIKIIYQLLKKFPAEEKYDLVSQGKRAVVSIALNIAEGSGRHTDKDFSLFINRAITSLQEVDGVLKIGMKLNYITDEDYQSVVPLIEKEYYKLVAFDKALIKGATKRRRYVQ
ncbi:four helix bundle protein [candidate division WOR-3 bacterium]|nr:four helix bundle protein [candidate division WOR-3 bacterium]